MKIAITGASGYLGRSLTQAFLAHNHEVICLSRRSCDTNWVPYSLQDDPEQLPWDDVDALVHAAFDFSVRSWKETNIHNVLPSIRLLDAAARRNVGRLILISSLSSFSGTSSYYGRAKFAIEEHVISLGGHVIRPGLVWDDELGGVTGSMQTMVGKLPFIPYPTGGPNNTQYLVHRADVAEAVVWHTEHADSTSYLTSVAHPHPWSIHEILTALGRRSGRKSMLIPVPWVLLYAPLYIVELLGLRLPLRGDSLWGLVHGNTRPDLYVLPGGVNPRPFA